MGKLKGKRVTQLERLYRRPLEDTLRDLRICKHCGCKVPIKKIAMKLGVSEIAVHVWRKILKLIGT